MAQKRQELRHDFKIEMIDERVASRLKGQAINDFVNKSETNQVRLIVNVFMTHLLHEGYVIKKVKDE